MTRSSSPNEDSSTGGRKRKAARLRKGKPLLTDEQKRLILSAIEAGATDHVAAQVAGISPRTFRELRQRAEGRHPARPSTRELREFFEQVDEAIARARMKREVEIAERDAKHWLAYRARSKPGFEGWSEPIPEPSDSANDVRPMTAEDLREVVTTLVTTGAVLLNPCPDSACSCGYHTPPTDEGSRA